VAAREAEKAAQLAKIKAAKEAAAAELAEARSRAELVLGPVWTVEKLTLPSSTKRVKSWSIRPESLLSSTVHRLPHSMEGRDTQSQAAASALVKVRVKMPADVLVPSEPVVKAWQAATGKWESAGISVNEYDQDSRLLTVSTLQLMPMAVVQPRFRDLPFQHWSVTPVSALSAGLVPGSGGGAPAVTVSVRTPRATVSVLVTSEGCRLTGPDVKALHGLRQCTLGPGELLRRLRMAGINILPIDEDAKLLGDDERVTVREAGMEKALHGDIAALCTTFAFECSKWNMLQPADSAVLRARECMDPDEPASSVHPTDWRTVSFGVDSETPRGIKAVLINATEAATEFDGSVAAGMHSRSYLSGALEPRSTPEAIAEAAEGAPLVQGSVQRLLQLLRPLSFH
jgi:hypothetical protein